MKGLGVCLLFLLSVVPARAQGPRLSRTLDSATVVRLHFVDRSRAVGRLVAPFGSGSDSVRYAPVNFRCCDVVFAIPRTSVAQIDVQRGNRAARGFVIGTLAAGLVITPLMYIRDALGEGGSGGDPVLDSIALSVLIGGGVGLLIGHGSPTWSPAP